MRHDVALRQYQQIAEHNIGSRDFALVTISNDTSTRGSQLRECGDGTIRAEFLADAHHRVRRDDQQYDRHVGPVADDRGQCGCRQQHHDQRVTQLTRNALPQPGWRRLRNGVGAVACEPRRGL